MASLVFFCVMSGLGTLNSLSDRESSHTFPTCESGAGMGGAVRGASGTEARTPSPSPHCTSDRGLAGG